MGVKFNYNMAVYTREFGRLFVQGIGTEIRIEARKLVRVKSHDLQGSIRFDLISYSRGEVSANTPYAAAQEWGLAPFGKPNYGFTPYMRPAAAQVMKRLRAIAKEASATALRLAKV